MLHWSNQVNAQEKYTCRSKQCICFAEFTSQFQLNSTGIVYTFAVMLTDLHAQPCKKSSSGMKVHDEGSTGQPETSKKCWILSIRLTHILEVILLLH